MNGDCSFFHVKVFAPFDKLREGKNFGCEIAFFCVRALFFLGFFESTRARRQLKLLDAWHDFLSPPSGKKGTNKKSPKTIVLELFFNFFN